MRTNMTILLALIVFMGCQTSEKSVEDSLYACLVEQYDEKQIDLAASLDSLEDHLVNVGVLTSKDGKGKIKYYQEIIEQGEVHYTSDTPLMKSLRSAFIGTEQVIACVKESPAFDSLEYYSSEFHRTSQKVLDHVETSGATTPVNVSKAILANLTANDFEHPFYRTQVLLSFVMTNERQKAYVRTVPIKLTAPEPTTEEFIIDISKSKVFSINNQPVQKTAIEPALVQYMEKLDSSIYIRIKVSGETPYAQLLEVQTSIRNARKRYWNMLSMKKFNRPFDQLTSDEVESIESQYPVRITEEVPK